MGMFDTVEIDGNCWYCGVIIPRWQTKQLYSLMDVYRQHDRIPLHPNHKHLTINSNCNGKKEWTTMESKIDEKPGRDLREGCGKSNDVICLLDENMVLKGIEVLSPTDERMRYTR